MTTRRTFLRVLGSAIVGAVVAPALPIPVPSAAAPPTWWDLHAAADAGALTFDMLRRAYESCALGERGPSLMIVSSSVARRLGLVYDVEIDEAIGEAA